MADENTDFHQITKKAMIISNSILKILCIFKTYLSALSKRKRNLITFLSGSYTYGCQPFLSSSFKMRMKSFHFPNK